MVEEGNWSVSLDDGSDLVRIVEIDGAERLEISEILSGTVYGRRWRITHVKPEILFARAVPIDDVL